MVLMTRQRKPHAVVYRELFRAAETLDVGSRFNCSLIYQAVLMTSFRSMPVSILYSDSTILIWNLFPVMKFMCPTHRRLFNNRLAANRYQFYWI